MRLPLASAWQVTMREMRHVAGLGLLRPALREALLGLPWALRRRSVVPDRVHEMYRVVYEDRR